MNIESSSGFSRVLEEHFRGAVPIDHYFNQTTELLEPYGFNDDNTLGIIATCRDEIASPLEHELVKHWGRTFSCRSLGGFLLLGQSGIKTGISHAPQAGGRRRFVFFAMPHIAISLEGKIGVIYREGFHQESNACGSLAAVVSQLESGQIDVYMDFEDLEQSCVRQKLISNIHYGDKLDLIGATKLASRIIYQDTVRHLTNIAKSPEFEYAYFTGILIHGPNDIDWIYPGYSEIVMEDLPGGRVPIMDRQ